MGIPLFYVQAAGAACDAISNFRLECSCTAIICHHYLPLVDKDSFFNRWMCLDMCVGAPLYHDPLAAWAVVI